MYKTLLSFMARLTKDEQGLIKKDLPKLFDTYNETTSVVFPLDDDFMSFSASADNDCLVVQNSHGRTLLSKSQTSDILKLINTF